MVEAYEINIAFCNVTLTTVLILIALLGSVHKNDSFLLALFIGGICREVVRGFDSRLPNLVSNKIVFGSILGCNRFI